MLVASSIGQITSWGVLFYSFPVFLSPMEADLGWSIAQMTGAYSLALLVSGVAAIPVGRWLDLRGPRVLMSVCSIAATLLVVAWAFVDSLLAFYLIWIGIGLVMAGVLYEPVFYLVANWFRRRRSRALTILTFIAGLASVIYIPLANWLVDAAGWRSALLILAAVLAVGTTPIYALLLRHSPQDLGLEPDGDRLDFRREGGREVMPERSLTRAQAMRHRGFWWLAAAFFLATLATMAVIVHLIPYLMSVGYDRSFAAGTAGAVGLLALPGRLVFTPLGSVIPRRYITALIFLLQGVALGLLLMTHSRLGVILFVILFGAGFGAITPARAALVAEGYGPALWQHHGRHRLFDHHISGHRAGGEPGDPWLVRGYTTVLWILVILSGLSALAALQARPPDLDGG
ncbi:MAG: MFS transporter [Thermomicrobiales bacterium]